MAEPWVLGELKSVISLLRLTDWQSDNIPAYKMVLNILIFPNLTFTRAAGILWISSSITCVRVHIPCCQKMALATLHEPRLGYDTWHLLLSCSCSCSNFLHHTLSVILGVKLTNIFLNMISIFRHHVDLCIDREEVDTNFINNKLPILRSCRDCLICFNSRVRLKCPWLPLLKTGINFIDDANLNLGFLSK